MRTGPTGDENGAGAINILLTFLIKMPFIQQHLSQPRLEEQTTSPVILLHFSAHPESRKR